jgi:Raf kinase inhibitor-like YbhB/YbcL family protein
MKKPLRVKPVQLRRASALAGTLLLASLCCSGCSRGSGEAGTGESAATAPLSPDWVLTSSAVAAGGTIPDEYTCVSGIGPKPSPPLEWPAGPPGTLGYAIVLHDETNKWTHWAIWDIPATVLALPRDVSQASHTLPDLGGARQVGGDNSSMGYISPCPPDGTHDYVFTVYAQKALPLPGASTQELAGDVKARLDKAASTIGIARLATKVTK